MIPHSERTTGRTRIRSRIARDILEERKMEPGVSWEKGRAQIERVIESLAKIPEEMTGYAAAGGEVALEMRNREVTLIVSAGLDEGVKIYLESKEHPEGREREFDTEEGQDILRKGLQALERQAEEGR